MIRSLILEDEKAAIEVLSGYIEKTPFMENLGSYESGLDIPLDVLAKVDVLFLDIQLPELDGLSFLKSLSNPPRVIITTAYPDYAIDAFEVAVTDYLLKPYSYERFYKAINRIREQLLSSTENKSSKLILYADKTMYKIDSSDILFLKSEVDYVKVVTTVQQILILDSLQSWEEKLRELPFKRTHRSYIVNMEQIDRVTGNQIFIAENFIPIGRTYKNGFIEEWNRIS